MHRLFLVYDDKDFAEWIEEELADYGRFIRSFESLDFFFPQWNASGSIDVIILPETVITSEDSFSNLYRTVKAESPDTVFLLIHHRDTDSFIDNFIADGNICVSYDELDTGLLENRLRNRMAPKSSKPVDAYDKHLNKNSDLTPDQTQSKQDYKIEIQNITTNGSESVPEDNNKISSDKLIDDWQKVSVEEPPHDINRTPEIIEQLSSKMDVDDQTHLPQIESPLQIPVEETTVVPIKKKRSTEEQKAKLQRIKERIIIEEKIVTVHVPVHFNSMLVSIVSLYPRAGATFVTSNFARMLGENKVPVAVLEPVLKTVGSTFYELMHGEKNAPKEWKSWAQQIQSKGYIAQETNWTSEGVSWIPSNIEPTPNWTEEQNMQLLLAANRFPVTLCDISSNYKEEHSKKILNMSDEIWIVTDGDPIQLSHHYKTIDNFKNEYPGKHLKVIGNKWNSHIKQSEWKEAILLPVLTQIPDFGSFVIKLLWDGKMAWDDAKMKNALSSPFKPMTRSVVAKEMFGLMKKQYGLGAKLSSLFRKIKSLEDEVKTRKL